LPFHACSGHLGPYTPYIGYGTEILYRAASGLERAMADVESERLTGIDAELITETWDPQKCPLSLLPYLAWAMGVNFWNPHWSETTQRAWVSAQWEFKSLRGTVDGTIMAVDYAGRDVSPFGYSVKGVITQPQNIYFGPSPTQAQRNAWLATLPQVRVYYFNYTGTASPLEFFVGSWLGTSSWDGRAFNTPPNESESLMGRASSWVVDGVLTDIPVQDFGNYFQLRIPGQASDLEMYDDTLCATVDGFGYTTPDTSWRRLVTIAPLTAGPYPIAVGPSLQAINASPVLVAVPGVAGYDSFCGSNYYPLDPGGMFMAPDNTPLDGAPLPVLTSFPAYPSFLLPDTSKYRLYHAYYVYDPNNLEPDTVAAVPGPMESFMGIGYWGWPDFTARIDVSASSISSAGDMFCGISYPNLTFGSPYDDSSTIYVASAIEAARRLSDKCLLNTAPKPVFEAGSVFLAGTNSFIVGQALISQ
jgi:phage tail P2-like protein